MPNPWPRRGTTQRQAGIREGFKSGLEDKTATWLEAHGEPVLYETVKIPYVIPASAHRYSPDFPLRNGIIVETKGRFLTPDRVKHLLVKAQYPDLDVRFVFSSAKARIGPGSSTTLAQWCDKYGFKWAEKQIPEGWLREPGPTRKPEDVLRASPRGYEGMEFPKRRAG